MFYPLFFFLLAAGGGFVDADDLCLSLLYFLVIFWFWNEHHTIIQ